MRFTKSRDRIRVMLIDKTRLRRSTGAFSAATAPAALGAFCLKRFVETDPRLRNRVEIVVRSYAFDAPCGLIVHEIVEQRPDLIGMTCQPWNTLDNIQIGSLLRQLLPETIVVHGGPMVVDRNRYLEKVAGSGVSVVVEGEGEETFAELLLHLLDGAPPLKSIAGLGFFDEGGQPAVTAPRESPDVSRLPPVMTPEHLDALGAVVPYETSRGCPYQCSFCNWGGRRTSLRFRSREVIEQDVGAILGADRVQQLWFVDSAVDVSVDHVRFLADVIRRHRRHPVFVGAFFNFQSADLSYAADLAGAFDFVRAGLQTANDKVLSDLGRKELGIGRVDRIREMVLPHFPTLLMDVMFGLPGVTMEDLAGSVRFLLDRDIRYINLFRLQAMPGTELAERRDVYGLVADMEYPFMVYAHNGCSAERIIEMQQFKVNVDALRPLFWAGLYAELRRKGVDLIDFARRLHTFVPRINHRMEYGMADDDDLDWGPDLVDAVLRAASLYTDDPERESALASAAESAYSLLSRPVQAQAH